MACLRRYGSPIICLNLVKKKERKKRESLLTNELQSSITYLNQFLPPEHHIGYIHKDMARINKRSLDIAVTYKHTHTYHTLKILDRHSS